MKIKHLSTAENGKVSQLLESVGLSKTESDIYLAGLGIFNISANELSQKTDIKRPTVYHALSTLSAKGLVSKKIQGNGTLFSFTDPALLPKILDEQISMMERKKIVLNEAIPLLATIKHVNIPKVLVNHYEGIEGIKALFEQMYYCNSRHWDLIAPKNNFFYQFDQAYMDYYLEIRKKRNITARSLYERGINEYRGGPLKKEEIPIRNPRYLPAEMNEKFFSVVYLFDRKVVFVSSVNELSAILIQSEDVYSTIQAMFDTLWNISEPY
ncbi:MAG: helix-turn-helix domain-containing protein [Candidatus Magasanikbacteria bacterium]|jgi:sugar-specific transcriptional regulator TrmB